MNKSFGRNKEYEQHLEGRLPEELERFRHSVEWPIDPNLENFHLANYYLDEMEIGTDFMHNGVDIHVPAQTPIYAPEKSAVILLRQDEARDICLGDLIIQSLNSGIVYVLAHIDYFDIPDKIRNNIGRSCVTLEKGEQIAKVGYWPFKNEDYGFLPEKLRRGENYYCHLHLGMEFCPNISKFREDMNPRFNPLLVLKRL